MLHCRDGIGQVMSGAWFPPDMTLGIQAKEFNLCFNRPENFVSHGLRVLQVDFGKLQAGCHVPFTEWLLSGHSTMQVIGGELQRWLSFWKVLLSSQLHWSSVRVTIGFLVNSLTKALLPRSLSLAGWPALGRVLVVPDFFHWWMMEATVLIGTFNAPDIFLYPSPDLCLNTILSRRSTDNSLDFTAWFVLWHALSTVGPYIDGVCLSKSCPINWIDQRWTPIKL